MTMHDDFAFVDEVVNGVRWDAKYATWDNFTGKPVDGYLANRIVGSRALCAALERARLDRGVTSASAFFCGTAIGHSGPSTTSCNGPDNRRMTGRRVGTIPNIDRVDIIEHGIRGRQVGPQPGKRS